MAEAPAVVDSTPYLTQLSEQRELEGDLPSTVSPTMMRLAASGEEVDAGLGMTVSEVEAASVSYSDLVDSEPPMGNDWRAHRLFDLSDNAAQPDKPAIMRVVVTTPIPGGGLIGTKVIPDYSRFFLQGAQEQDMEKAHIVETFGSYWVHLFGRKPRVFTFSGTLLSNQGQDWEAAWDMLYDRYMRATRCVEMGTQAQLTYGKRSVYGYILGTGKSKDSVNDKSVGFTFSMLVTHVEWITGARILSAQFGVSDLDELATRGSLTSLEGVATAVRARDAAAADVTASVLAGTEFPSSVTMSGDQTSALESLSS